MSMLGRFVKAHKGSPSYPFATPGPWFGLYDDAWEAAHPGAFMCGEMMPGAFHAGDVWCTYTPEFDRQWFEDHWFRMPRRMRVLTEFPQGIPVAGRLEPGESITVQISQEPPSAY